MPTEFTPFVVPEASLALTRAGRWLLSSGIQEREGGVARYYLVAEERNLPVSTEITGYAVSAYVFLFHATGDERYLEGARRTARFLVSEAWNRELEIFPFECLEGSPAYFFDCGIIIRGLLALWRVNRDRALLDVAAACGQSMARHFLTARAIHPVIGLPGFEVLPYQKRWSREPGCLQLKSALAWRDLWQATGETEFRGWWEQALQMALASHTSFLPGSEDREKVMDRLHAYSYFLEAALAERSRNDCQNAVRTGLVRASGLLREIAPVFARSDVYAQILRVRLLADAWGIVKLDEAAAEEEARAIESFQYNSADVRLDGGFCFGRKPGGMLPYANPVSTAFCGQAMEMWRRRSGGEFTPSLESLV